MAAENSVGDVPRPTKPSQWSLRLVLFLFFQIGLFLALATQFRHIGIVAGLLLIGTFDSLWRKKWRDFAALLTCTLIFVTTYLACWVGMDARHMNYRPYRYNDMAMGEIHKSIAKYVAANNGIPNSLEELKPFGLNFGASNRYLDGWDGPIHYARTSNGFELVSLGRDHCFGGVGLDADISYAQMNQEQPRLQLPLKQFLFETDGGFGVFLAASLASFFSVILWKDKSNSKPLRKPQLIIRVIITFILALVVAGFLAAFHVASIQSGH